MTTTAVHDTPERRVHDIETPAARTPAGIDDAACDRELPARLKTRRS